MLGSTSIHTKLCVTVYSIVTQFMFLRVSSGFQFGRHAAAVMVSVGNIPCPSLYFFSIIIQFFRERRPN